MEFLFFFFGLIPEVVHAIGIEDLGLDTATADIFNNSGVCQILEYCDGTNGVLIITSIVINTILWVIGGAATVVILYAAIRLVTSAGNDETVRKSWKEVIFYAVLGLILTVLADVILNYVMAKIAAISAM